MSGDKKNSGWRVNRKKHGFTWSKPTGVDVHPIKCVQDVVNHLLSLGSCKYCVCNEWHDESGGIHYHGYANYDDAIDSINERLFDIEGVHPNWIKPKGGWLSYVQKDGDRPEQDFQKEILTNIEKDVFKEASKKRSWAEAAELLWESKPKFMLQYAANAEKNFTKKQKLTEEEKGRIFYGPWPKIQWDEDKCLVLRGPAGCGKTQMAKYLARHSKGEWLYVKGPIDKAKKHYRGQPFIIFDDISPYEKWTVNDWCSLFDVENGGSVNLRNAPLDLDPGPRVLIDNNDVCWPADNKLDRRIQIVDCGTA